MAAEKPRKAVIELGEDGLATVVAALRLFQRTYRYRDTGDISADFPEIFAAEQFQFGAVLDPTPLGLHDIDDLCEQLNGSNMLSVTK